METPWGLEVLCGAEALHEDRHDTIVVGVADG
jgi:hypothetical protein